MNGRSAAGMLGLLWAALACGSGERGPDAAAPAEVRDSAGVRIVQSRVPDDGLPEWSRLSPEPTLDVSAALGAPLRSVVQAVTLADGRIAVADGERRGIAYFSPAGEELAWRGGEGWQEGRYGAISRMGRAGGDSLWVFDPSLNRLTVLGPAGEVADTVHLPGGTVVQGRFADGSFLLIPGWSPSVRRAQGGGELRRDSAVWMRLLTASGDTVPVGAFPHPEMLLLDTPEGQVYGIPPFGRKTSVEVGPGRFYVGDQETLEIRGHDPDGTLREIVRLEGVDLALTRAEVEDARARSDTTAAWEERFWAAVPDTKPAYSRFLLDGAGNLWVAEHVSALAPPRNWLVFAPDGAVLGLVEVPPGLTLHEVGSGHVLGVAVEDGVPRVRRYGLERVR